jgi:DNA-binding transcriptional LysR family regulator
MSQDQEPAISGGLARGHRGVGTAAAPIGAVRPSISSTSSCIPTRERTVPADQIAEAAPWADRRKVDLAELVEEPWILSPPNTWSYERLVEAFKARGLEVPKARLVTYSMDFRTKLLAGGRFITVIPASLLRIGEEPRLKLLPVDLPVRRWPVTVLTLKNRTLTPVVERFIECAHEVAKPLVRNK